MSGKTTSSKKDNEIKNGKKASAKSALAVVIFVILILGVGFLSFKVSKYQTENPPSGEVPAEEFWLNPARPIQSLPLEEADIPKEAVKITVSSADGFLPAMFEVKPGEKVVLALINKDEKEGHVLMFKEKGLSQVGIGVGPAETKVITFYAPQEPGEYEFYCPLIGHETGGEKGKMTVIK